LAGVPHYGFNPVNPDVALKDATSKEFVTEPDYGRIALLGWIQNKCPASEKSDPIGQIPTDAASLSISVPDHECDDDEPDGRRNDGNTVRNVHDSEDTEEHHDESEDGFPHGITA
jgi:hypothetical protein